MDDLAELQHHLDAAASAAGSQLAHIREAQEALDRLIAGRPTEDQADEVEEPTQDDPPEPVGAILAQRRGDGPVTRSSLSASWGGASVSAPTGNLDRCTFTGTGTRHQHNAGRNGPGINYAVSLPGRGVRKATARWHVMFEEGFSFGGASVGGKVGGLGIGDVVVGGNGTPERLAAGGSLRLTWHGDDNGNAVWRPYAYHQGQSGRYGDGIVTTHPVVVGRPIEIAMTVDLVRCTGRITVDGVVISDRRYTWPADMRVTKVLAHLYHGGGTDDFGPTRDCWSRFDSFAVWED